MVQCCTKIFMSVKYFQYFLMQPIFQQPMCYQKSINYMESFFSWEKKMENVFIIIRTLYRTLYNFNILSCLLEQCA